MRCHKGDAFHKCSLSSFLWREVKGLEELGGRAGSLGGREHLKPGGRRWSRKKTVSAKSGKRGEGKGDEGGPVLGYWVGGWTWGKKCFTECDNFRGIAVDPLSNIGVNWAGPLICGLFSQNTYYTIRGWLNPKIWSGVYRRPTIKLYVDFQLLRVGAPNPHAVQGSTVVWRSMETSFLSD